MPARSNLPRRFSLKGRTEIRRLLASGRRLSGNLGKCCWLDSDEFGFAILLPKGFGRAVDRNRTKRLYREAIRTARRKLVGNVRICILVHRQARGVSFDEVAAEIDSFVRRINRTCKPADPPS